MNAGNDFLSIVEFGDACRFDDPRGQVAAALKAQSPILKRSLGLSEEPLVLDHESGRSSIRARGVAGTIRVGGTWIEIVPQFAAEESGSWVDALLTLMHRATAKGAFAIPFGAIAGQRRADFVDYISTTYANHLITAYRCGLIRTYNSSIDSGRAVRGRLLTSPSAIVATLRNPGAVNFEEVLLDERNEFNDLLLWAGNLLLGMTRRPNVRALLRLAISPLSELSASPSIPPRRLRAIPRQYGEYSIPLQIAEELLRGNVARIQMRGVDGSSLLIKTASIYERFVERSVSIAAAKLGLSSNYQASVTYASPQGAYPALRTRPDVLVTRASKPVLVVDAKYKIVDKTTRRTGTANDYYQMLTSMIAHKVHDGLLLFPTGHGPERRPQSWTVVVGSEKYRLHSASLDIGRLSTRDGLAAIDYDLVSFLRIAIGAF